MGVYFAGTGAACIFARDAMMRLCYANFTQEQIRGGRLDGYKNVYLHKVWGPPDPIRTHLPGPGIGPQGPGTRSPGHPEKFSDRHKIEERPRKIQNQPDIQHEYAHPPLENKTAVSWVALSSFTITLPQPCIKPLHWGPQARRRIAQTCSDPLRELYLPCKLILQQTSRGLSMQITPLCASALTAQVSVYGTCDHAAESVPTNKNRHGPVVQTLTQILFITRPISRSPCHK
jgi:hypothetical protein